MFSSANLVGCGGPNGGVWLRTPKGNGEAPSAQGLRGKLPYLLVYNLVKIVQSDIG